MKVKFVNFFFGFMEATSEWINLLFYYEIIFYEYILFQNLKLEFKDEVIVILEIKF